MDTFLSVMTCIFHLFSGASIAIVTGLWFFIWWMVSKRQNSISSRLGEVQIQQMKDNVRLRTDISRLSMILHTQQRRMDGLELQMTGKVTPDIPCDKELLDIMTRVNGSGDWI